MKKIALYFLLSFLVTACGGKNKEISIHKKIDLYEDSIKQWGGGLGTKDEINDFAERYISTLLEAYNEEPKNPNNPTYLDRVHMWYASIDKPLESIKWGTVILEKYPQYENREMVIESIASLYDGDVTPRDSNKVREYYNQLLKEFPNMDKEKKEGIEKRLKYNNLSLMEFIMKGED